MFSSLITRNLIQTKLMTKTSLVSSLQLQQVRLIKIVKRKTKSQFPKPWESQFIVGPVLKDDVKYKEFRWPADYIYTWVGDTDKDSETKEWIVPPPLKVLLLEAVDELGMPGDIVEVDRNRARFELILPKIAAYASPYNLIKYKHLIERRSRESTGPSSRFSRVTCKKLEQHVLLVTVSPVCEWTIDKTMIRISLRSAGYNVPEHAIQLPETPISGPDIPEKQGKDFAITIVVNNHEKVNVRCFIHHNGEQLKPNWFKGPRKVLLPEQEELLSTMPVKELTEEEMEKVEEQFESVF